MAESDAPILSTDLVSKVIDNGPTSRQQFLVIGLCMFLNMLDGFDITAMAIVATPVANELRLTPDLLGIIFSFALAGMMAGAMLLAPLSDVIGRRKIIILSVILVGVSILFTALASTLVEFIVLRFISGLGAGAVIASQAALAAEYSPEKYRSLSVAITTAGYPFGAVMTSVVAGFIMPDFGWRGMFWFGGGLTLVMGIIAWRFIPESLKYLLDNRPQNALHKINVILKKLRRPILSELPDIKKNELRKPRGVVKNMTSLLGRKHRIVTLTLWTTFFLCFSTLYFLMSWIPRLMEQSGYSAEVGRLAFFLFNFGGVLGIFILGALSTRWKLTNLVSLFLFTSGILMVIFAISPNQQTLLMTIIFFMGVLQQGGFTGLYAAAAKLYPTEIRSTGIGWAVGLGRSGAVIGPAAAGFLIAAGLSMSGNYVVFALPMLIGGLIAYRLKVN
jgi:benzoate transport